MSIVAAKIAVGSETLELLLLVANSSEGWESVEPTIPGRAAELICWERRTGTGLPDFGQEQRALTEAGLRLEEIAAEYRLMAGPDAALSFPRMLPRLEGADTLVDRPVLFCDTRDRLIGAVPATDGGSFVALDFLCTGGALARNGATQVAFDPQRPGDDRCAKELLDATGPIRDLLSKFLGDHDVTLGLRLVDAYEQQLVSAAPQYKRDLVCRSSIDELTLVRYCSSVWFGCGVGFFGEDGKHVITGAGAAMAVVFLAESARPDRARRARAFFREHPKAHHTFVSTFDAVLHLCSTSRGREHLRALVNEHWGGVAGIEEFLAELSRSAEPS